MKNSDLNHGCGGLAPSLDRGVGAEVRGGTDVAGGRAGLVGRWVMVLVLVGILAVLGAMSGARAALPDCGTALARTSYGGYSEFRSCMIAGGFDIGWLGRAFSGTGCDTRLWSSFNLPEVRPPVVSARLVLRVATMQTPSEGLTLEVRSVETPYETVLRYTGDFGAVYADLGDGALYGRQFIGTNELQGTTVGAQVVVDLTAEAVAAINGWTNGPFVLGMAATGLSNSSVVEALWLSPAASSAVLLLEYEGTRQPRISWLDVTTNTVVSGAVRLNAVTCGEGPIRHQWFKDDVAIPGATNSTFLAAPAALTDAGRYQLRATNAYGSAASTTFDVSVAVASVTMFPSTISVLEFDSVCFSINSMSVLPATLDLRRDGVPFRRVVNGFDCLPSVRVSDSGRYDIVLRNPAGSVTSAVSVVTVNPRPPMFTAFPAGEVTAAAGVPLVLGAEVLGSEPLTYRWLKDGVPVPGASSLTLTLNEPELDDGGRYLVVASNVAGVSTSQVSRVTMVPAVLTGPYPLTADLGNDYFLSCQLVQGVPETTLQWFRDDAPLPGETNAFLWLRAITLADAGAYQVVASNRFGVVSTSRPLVQVAPRPPTAAIFVYGASIGAYPLGQDRFLTANVAGGPPPTLQWRKDGRDLSGQTNTLLAIRSATLADAGNYSLVAVNAYGAVTSNILPLQFEARAMSWLIVPMVSNAVAGSLVVLQVQADGGPPPMYQWRRHGADLPGETNASLVLPRVRLEDAGDYEVVARNDRETIRHVHHLPVTPATVLDRWDWQQPDPQGSRLRALASSNGRLVAVGKSGMIVTSTNGLDWTRVKVDADADFYGVAGGDGRFVAVGFTLSLAGNPSGTIGRVVSGLVMVSEDGVSWTPAPVTDLVGFDFLSVAYGNGIFVATGLGGFVRTSVDGRVWTLPPNGIEIARRVTFVDGEFWACTFSDVYRSTDGVNWRFVTRAPFGGGAEMVTGTGGRYVALGRYGQVGQVSNGGDQWIPYYHTNYQVIGLAAGNGRFVLTRKESDGAVFTSDEGRIWTRRETGARRELEAILYADGRFWAVGEAGTIISSPDGIDWSPNQVANLVDYYGLAQLGNRVIVAGDDGTILTSDDRRTWTRQSTPSGRNLHTVATGGGLAVTAGRGGRIMTSPNGLDWTTRTSGTTNYIERLLWAGGRWVGVCANSDIVTSTNGFQWTAARVTAALGVATDHEGVAYGGGYWMAVGGYFASIAVSTVFVSTNGQDWMAVEHYDGRDSKRFRDVTYGNQQFVAVGNDGRVTVFAPTGVAANPFRVAASYELPGPFTVYEIGPNFRRVHFANGKFVAVGNDGTIWSTTDPLRPGNWVRHRSRTPLNLHDVLAAADGSYYAVGNNGMILRAAENDLRFTRIQRLADRVVLEFDGSNEAGPIWLESSADLRTWGTLVAPASSPVEVPLAPAGAKFFRLRTP